MSWKPIWRMTGHLFTNLIWFLVLHIHNVRGRALLSAYLGSFLDNSDKVLGSGGYPPPPYTRTHARTHTNTHIHVLTRNIDCRCTDCSPLSFLRFPHNTQVEVLLVRRSSDMDQNLRDWQYVTHAIDHPNFARALCVNHQNQHTLFVHEMPTGSEFYVPHSCVISL